MNKKLLIGLAASIMSFTTLSYANFTFHSNDENACQYFAGQWAGTGTASNWLVECKYHGAGTSSAVDKNGNFSVDVTADKDSGSVLCPSHAEKHLTGICVNGNVTIITEYGDLAGTFTKNGGTAKGTLTVSPGISANVEMQFQRVG